MAPAGFVRPEQAQARFFKKETLETGWFYTVFGEVEGSTEAYLAILGASSPPIGLGGMREALEFLHFQCEFD